MHAPLSHTRLTCASAKLRSSGLQDQQATVSMLKRAALDPAGIELWPGVRHPGWPPQAMHSTRRGAPAGARLVLASRSHRCWQGKKGLQIGPGKHQAQCRSQQP